MNDKNGKRITKPRAKSMLCGAIARGYCNNFKSLKLDKVHEMMKEYGISRKSIHDTIVCTHLYNIVILQTHIACETAVKDELIYIYL